MRGGYFDCGLYGAFGLDGYALVEGKGGFEPFQGFSGIDFDHILRYIGADCGVGEFGEGNERDLIAFEDEVRRLDDESSVNSGSGAGSAEPPEPLTQTLAVRPNCSAKEILQ